MEQNLYELLKSGRSAEDLVADFTKQLNDAEAQIRAEEEARLAEERAQAECKREHAVEVLQNVYDFIHCYYPSLLEGTEEPTAEAMQGLADLLLAILDVEEARAQKPTKRKTKLPVEFTFGAPYKVNADVFADFFKSIGC